MIVDAKTRQVEYFITEDGRCPFIEWHKNLKDKKIAAKVMIRIERVKQGNFGFCNSIGKGLSELKMDFGPGYRVYFGQVANKIVIILCAGDKKSQSKDIILAKKFWDDFNRRIHVRE